MAPFVLSTGQGDAVRQVVGAETRQNQELVPLMGKHNVIADS
jgi:hypothetical protein